MAESGSEGLANRLFLSFFLVAAFLICIVGYRFYTAQRDAVEREVTNNLQAVADLRAEQITAWRQERFSNAHAIIANRPLLRVLHAVAAGRASAQQKQDVVQWLTDYQLSHSYANAVFLGAKANEILHLGRTYGNTGHLGKILDEVAAAKKPILRDLHSEGPVAEHLGLNVPLLLPGATRPFGMLSFAIDPEQYLFPMVDRWPGLRRVGETLLVSQNGDEALYLDNRVAKNKAGSRTHVGLDKREAVAVKALRGGSGLVRGVDREGRQVVAAVRAVPDSQWLVLAQTPLEVIDKPIRDRALPISLAVVSLILAAGMAAVYLLREAERRQEEIRRHALQEKEALATHYNFLSRSVTDAILLMDEHGRIVEANDYASVMYGYPREKLLAMNIADLRAPEDRHHLAQQWEQVQEQSAALFETVHARSDGSTFPAEVSSLAIAVEGRQYHQSIIRDITQRNLVRTQLENANRLYSVLSHCNQGILRAANEPEMLNAVCNAAIREGGFPLAMIVRLDRDTMDVRPVALAGIAQEYGVKVHISARDDRFGQGGTGLAFRTGKATVIDDFENDPRMAPWREQAKRLGLRSSVTIPIPRRGLLDYALVLYSCEPAFFNDREVRLIEEVAANISYALGRLDEEADRHSAEEALRNSEERYRLLVESSPVGMYVHTGGIVRYMNARGLEIIGLRSLDEVLGASIYSFIHPADHDAIRERIRILDAGGAVPLIEERFVRPDGSSVSADVSAVPILFNGDPSKFVFFIDATERKKAEEARARMEEQFLQAQKMESIGRMAGGVAHDFNNSLTVINGYCDLLLNSLSKEDPVRGEIEHIQKAGRQAAAMTRQLLAFSRRQAFSPQLLDLNEVVTEDRALLGRLFSGQIKIETKLSPHLPGVVADPTQLHQVLMNLVINARDAMPNGGEIHIATHATRLGEEDAAKTVDARPGEFVVLSVSDTGVGMDAETQRHIFEPFFTTKPRGTGTGLGLSTVYGIVHQSKGWVEVESAPGAGTTFQILLPTAAGCVTPAAGPVVSPDAGHGTILLAEDHADVRQLTRIILESLGYSVLEADSGAHALEIFQRDDRQIDLLLTDVIMPGMSGPELAKRLRALRPALPVLYVSGYNEDACLATEGPDGAYHLLSKPFTPTALAAKVRELIKR